MPRFWYLNEALCKLEIYISFRESKVIRKYYYLRGAECVLLTFRRSSLNNQRDAAAACEITLPAIVQVFMFYIMEILI